MTHISVDGMLMDTADFDEGEMTDTFPEGWTDVGYTTPAEELPIVVGKVGVDGKVRVDEETLEPGRYRIRAGDDGEIVGELTVIDPVVARKSNRHDRRQEQRIRRYKMPPHPLAGVRRRSR